RKVSVAASSPSHDTFRRSGFPRSAWDGPAPIARQDQKARRGSARVTRFARLLTWPERARRGAARPWHAARIRALPSGERSDLRSARFEVSAPAAQGRSQAAGGRFGGQKYRASLICQMRRETFARLIKPPGYSLPACPSDLALRRS